MKRKNRLGDTAEACIFLLKNHFLEEYKHNDLLCSHFLTILKGTAQRGINVHFAIYHYQIVKLNQT